MCICSRHFTNKHQVFYIYTIQFILTTLLQCVHFYHHLRPADKKTESERMRVTQQGMAGPGLIGPQSSSSVHMLSITELFYLFIHRNS